jgi:RNA polymerase sigma-70 factor (ECF subfamily)
MPTRNSQPLENGPVTSGSLIQRLHTWSDHSAWQRFFTNYNPLLEAWTRTQLRNPADAQELVQLLWCELSRRLRSFNYNPAGSFRGWLRCLHSSRLRDFLKIERRRIHRELQHASAVARKTAIPQPTLSASAASESARHKQRLEHALRIQEAVRKRVSERTWAVFHDIAVLGLDIADSAARHQMRYAAAWAAFSRVHQMLKVEASRENSP